VAYSRPDPVGLASLVLAVEVGYFAGLSLRPGIWPLREVAAGLAIASLVLGGIWIGVGVVPAWYLTLLLLLALATWLLALAAPDRLGGWLSAALGFSLGLALATSVAAAVGHGPASLPSIAGLWTLGSLTVATGLTRGRPRLLQTGLLAWLVAALLVLWVSGGTNRHLYLLTIALFVLAIIEIERWRTKPGPPPVALQVIEAIVMATPLIVAATDSMPNMAYLPVLAVESLVIFTWGVVTEVKRRAFLGFGGLLAAIVLSAVIPVNYQLRSGIDVLGTVLAIGMPSAIVLIATAAAIEKYRDRIGFAVRRVVEVVNGWE